MSFEKILKLRHTLAFRLTLWYAGTFTISLLVAFLFFYLSIASITEKRTDHELSTEVAEFSSLLASSGMEAVIENINIEAASSGVEEIFLCVLTADGQVVASSNRDSWKGAGISKAALAKLAAGENRVFVTEQLPDQSYSVRTVYGPLGNGKILQIVHSLKDDEDLLKIIREIFLFTLVVLMLPAAFIGWFMARRALQGVEDVTRTATEISTGTLDLRVPRKAWGDEIDRLAGTFNSMLDRIHALIAGMREMTDNIAHDLRSPITRIRGLAEMTLMGHASLEDYDAMAASTIEECDRLLEMINTMLDITEVEAGAAQLKFEEVNFSELIKDACELFEPLADDKHICLDLHIMSGVKVVGDLNRLQRMVANMLDNAIKYTPSGGSVAVSVNADDRSAVVRVTDTGIGIAEKELPRIFERFYRGERCRTQAGSGLGLSLAQAVACAHGGGITVNSSLGEGTTFTITLPLITTGN